MRLIGDNGEPLDAEWSVEPEGDRLAIIVESSSGASQGRPARNPDYIRMLTTLLRRLKALDATLVDALVDSRATKTIPEDGRRLLDHLPVSLADVPNMASFRLVLTRGAGRIGRSSDSNRSKRLRLRVAVPGYDAGDVERLARDLANPHLASDETALEIRQEVRKTRPEAIQANLQPGLAKAAPFLPEFKPKNDTEYLQQVQRRQLVKTRKHETLVRDYGNFLISRGLEVATNVHPRDMLALREGAIWLIEAKMVRHGNGMNAAREALGQLLAYRYLHHRDEPVTMVALFSESIGEHAVSLLEAHDVASVWYDTGHWRASTLAHPDLQG